jgi:hypothetical protein
MFIAARATMRACRPPATLTNFWNRWPRHSRRTVARAIVALRARPELELRVAYLRERANEGTLTPDEDAEYKDFVEAVDVLSIIQSKARRFLAGQSS